MRKLKAIWQLLWADKWAVFTCENAPESDEWVTAPYFRWNISHKDWYFIDLIKQRIQNIIESKANNE